ncbi:muscarinic acetylcholine receptor M1 [Phlebotomus argentipes]|uniref:muscarinic acetylcholine receptor M1 n=1 Tax=Phlebotomus argentipes TaxID=94469 RepID=UPI002893604B|nr:muscarinic acetylcholine receptor M1 [Phlebotomus argentipes]XP_059610221.1 muscarinic acetylcholine receptor M1 [Phlebotomus argentipes]
MAIDFFIGALLLLSASVNVLALGAFWMTPSLRTTANRFVINLLIVNLICCIILGPSLLLNCSALRPATEDADETPKFSCSLNRTAPGCSTNIIFQETAVSESKNTIVIAEIDEEVEELDESPGLGVHLWTLDVAAALGALSVLLVVGDTWCAVTDPLRYHSRVSGPRAWALIGATWCLGIVFGVASIFRGEDTSLYESEGIYSAVFSFAYFLVIILLPFGLVCAMYWRIFREARSNGLRMRQNGSSPLLQSALNLTSSNAQTAAQQNLGERHSSVPPGGLLMKLDKEYDAKDSSTKPLLLNKHLEIPKSMDRNQNSILLSLSLASGESMRRNYSARQLFPLEHLEDEDLRCDLRHANSTPNLHKHSAVVDVSGPLLPLPTVQVHPKALSYMTSIRHRLSNASSLFKYREESRAARISILVVIMFLVSYIPYGLLMLLEGHSVPLLSPADRTLVAIFAVVLGNLSSPFIFAYRNKRVRRGVRRLMGIDAKTNERLQRRRNTTKTKTITLATGAKTDPKNTFVLEVEKCPDFAADQQKLHNQHNLLHPPKIPSFEPHASPRSSNADSIFGKKRSLLKRMCDTSRKWGCATDSCASEQTDV